MSLWKFTVILLVAVMCVCAEEESPKSDPQPSSLIETAFCYLSKDPLNCVRTQAARTLNYWHAKVEEKKQELLDEADEEVKESEKARGLSDEEKKEVPSQIINNLDKGFSVLANFVSDEVKNFRRDGRSLKGNDENKQLDDINDFNSDAINDDSSVLQKFSMMDEGNVTEEGRGKELNKAYKQGNKQGYNGAYDDDGIGYGYGGYKGKGKKGKKGKKGLMKMFFLGAVLKSKIEMLLKILSFHLQLKFFAIALINMVINLARFWIDLKKQPQKVVYVEHAQHQHHYDHDEHDWGNSWKRNTNTQGQQEYNGDFAHRYAYSGQQQYPATQTY